MVGYKHLPVVQVGAFVSVLLLLSRVELLEVILVHVQFEMLFHQWKIQRPALGFFALQLKQLPMEIADVAFRQGRKAPSEEAETIFVLVHGCLMDDSISAKVRVVQVTNFAEFSCYI